LIINGDRLPTTRQTIADPRFYANLAQLVASWLLEFQSAFVARCSQAQCDWGLINNAWASIPFISAFLTKNSRQNNDNNAALLNSYK